ncbi:hypothetical protein QBC34DRAFT_390767 [Podospora aff. communis PSN243]|uniref:Uncharacterized protein n=1 Tax=Podospora aff. communis PSN243 TaxID=3040156 RepID=A0AAV9H4X6_9PEZI|nr:hypothetical protein QBC34DRAFT_390767 [Podospora aff. communis PSN243]
MSAHKAKPSTFAYSFQDILASFGPRRQRLALVVLLVAGCISLLFLSFPFAVYGLSHGPQWSTILARFHWTSHRASEELSDTAVPVNRTWPHPRFHLLVDSRRKDANLCKALFSAAIHGYPPPVLVGYRGIENMPLDIADLFELALWAISDYRSHIKGEDLVMWLGEDSLIQLPADITVRRFLQQKEVVEQRLANAYPDLNIHQGVLFPAAKRCPYEYCNTTDSEALPESSLPRDMYGTSQKESFLETKFTRPRYPAPGAFIGKAEHVASLLKASLKALKETTEPSPIESILWNRLFINQSLTRQNHTPSFFTQLTNTITNLLQPESITLHNTTPDLGIHLDYESRLFQPLTPSSSNDITPLPFSPPTLAISPSKLAAHLYTSPLLLPPELSPSLSPFANVFLPPLKRYHPPRQDQELPPDPVDEEREVAFQKQLDELKRDITWGGVRFITNIAVPRGSIPSVLITSGGVSFEETWKGMWYRPYGRLLLEAYLRIGGRVVGEDGEEEGGEAGRRWRWNVRGGRGGVWTDEGAWIRWEEVCGAFEDKMFGEGSDVREEEGKVEKQEGGSKAEGK